MRFSSIIATVAFAVVAIAAPAEDIAARTTPSCSQGQTQACCDSITKQVPSIGGISLVPITAALGLNCLSVNGKLLDIVIDQPLSC